MTNVVGFKGRLAAFAIAFVAGVVLGTVVQTQFNLLALQQLGVEIGAGVRLSTTVDDLRQFGPFTPPCLASALCCRPWSPGYC